MQLQSFLDYTLLGLPITHITLSIIFFFTMLWFRASITKILLKPFTIIARRSQTLWDDKLIRVLEVPLQTSIIFLGAYGASSWLPYPVLQRFVDLCLKTFVTFLIFWILYR
ncbi:MAG: mechanosensitive ion channel family protein, partial [Epsilonproteobacteria bacterium]|nr:mechanosensitive ion channel family protein [Campylobacterota bacterium]